jgi:hypothetical protein
MTEEKFGYRIEWQDDRATCTPTMRNRFFSSISTKDLELRSFMNENHFFIKCEIGGGVIVFRRMPKFKAVLLNDAIIYMDASMDCIRTYHSLVYPVWIADIKKAALIRVNGVDKPLSKGDEIVVEARDSHPEKIGLFVLFVKKQETYEEDKDIKKVISGIPTG